MHHNTAKTLLTFTTAFSAKSVVGTAISFIQKQRPLLFSLLAHSRHSKQSSFPAENIKTTETIHSALFVSFLGAKTRENFLSKPFKKSQGVCTNLWLCMKLWVWGNKKHRISTVRSDRYILFYDSRKLEFTVLPSFPSSAP